MYVSGTGLPIATPFDDDGDVDETALRALVETVEAAGVDFVVPCGSNGEAVHMDVDERTRVTEVVAEATDGPVVAGTGHPSERVTTTQTTTAADAGADAALVVTPFYHRHDDAAVAEHYERVADASPIPIYLYSVPKFTDHALDPRTVQSLATHENVHGIKDSSGDLETLQRYVALTADADFDVLVGSGSVYAAALDAGATGGVLALANVVPGLAAEIYDRHVDGDDEGARELNRDLVELNRAVTAEYGVPGLKAAMRSRDYPAGQARRPFQPVSADVHAELATLVEDALEGDAA
ncbi:dihydrodipicolinate synthase family protein [Halorubellus sp. JP-L1]|uniref:dihydrodipicolinate synthase family protein n=1 Tax=Halorubellus sp. JP-L1 TaxID=2715753 RepID=UPI00140CA864|nr:dihydrodipicolinate synthase family protein [Halorubellus sp. JP-L1]NHN42073.1 dihydrodipicolinate synthase family protein [Halorubellus sp. JP-L1]